MHLTHAGHGLARFVAMWMKLYGLTSLHLTHAAHELARFVAIYIK